MPTRKATDDADASHVFARLADEGCLQNFDAVTGRDGGLRESTPAMNHEANTAPGEAKFWRHRDTPHYVRLATEELGIDWRTSPVGQRSFKRATQSPEMRDIGAILGELRERYFKAPKHGVVAQPTYDVKAHVEQRLAMAEEIVERLFVLAVSARIQLSEAFPAWGMPCTRTFAVDTASFQHGVPKAEDKQPEASSGKPSHPNRARNGG